MQLNLICSFQIRHQFVFNKKLLCKSGTDLQILISLSNVIFQTYGMDPNFSYSCWSQNFVVNLGNLHLVQRKSPSCKTEIFILCNGISILCNGNLHLLKRKSPSCLTVISILFNGNLHLVQRKSSSCAKEISILFKGNLHLV